MLIFIFYHRRRRGTREKKRIGVRSVKEIAFKKTILNTLFFLLHAFFLGCYNSAGFGVGQSHTNLIQPIHGYLKKKNFEKFLPFNPSGGRVKITRPENLFLNSNRKSKSRT
jgi:hypothetical protein